MLLISTFQTVFQMLFNDYLSCFECFKKGENDKMTFLSFYESYQIG